MMRLACAAVLAFFLFFYGLSHTGMLGQDEPRYAAIGMEMARSGDWITPRLLGAEWLRTGNRKVLPWAGLCFGLAILAKSLVAVVLALPLLWFGRTRWREMLLPAAIAIGVAAIWYVPCAVVNGWPFVQDLFLKHQFGRFTTNDLLHKQPFWYYPPVLLGLLMPWAPMAVAAVRVRLDTPDRRLLAA